MKMAMMDNDGKKYIVEKETKRKTEKECTCGRRY